MARTSVGDRGLLQPELHEPSATGVEALIADDQAHRLAALEQTA